MPLGGAESEICMGSTRGVQGTHGHRDEIGCNGAGKLGDLANVVLKV